MLTETDLTITRLRYTQGAPFWDWSTIIALAKKGRIRDSMFFNVSPYLCEPCVYFSLFNYAP